MIRMANAATQSTSKAHYLKDQLENAGLKAAYKAEFFDEFVTVCPCSADAILSALAKHGILGGLPIADDQILWCATEMNSKADIDDVAAIVASVTGKEA